MTHVSKDRPGVREQQLLRKMNNPLFGEIQSTVGKDDLAQARLEDGLEKDRFLAAFQGLIQKAVDLQPNTPSETVLEIKAELDRSYQQACALPGDMTPVKQSIIRLVDLIMQPSRAGWGVWAMPPCLLTRRVSFSTPIRLLRIRCECLRSISRLSRCRALSYTPSPYVARIVSHRNLPTAVPR